MIYTLFAGNEIILQYFYPSFSKYGTMYSKTDKKLMNKHQYFSQYSLVL